MTNRSISFHKNLDRRLIFNKECGWKHFPKISFALVCLSEKRTHPYSLLLRTSELEMTSQISYFCENGALTWQQLQLLSSAPPDKLVRKQLIRNVKVKAMVLCHGNIIVSCNIDQLQQTPSREELRSPEQCHILKLHYSKSGFLTPKRFSWCCCKQHIKLVHSTGRTDGV